VRSNRSKKTRAVVCVSCDGDDDDDAHDARSRREGVVPFCDSAATILFLSRTRGGWWWFRTRGGERRLLLRRLAEHQHGVANDVLQRRNPWYGGTLFFSCWKLFSTITSQRGGPTNARTLTPGKSYRGGKNTTRGGLRCVPWKEAFERCTATATTTVRAAGESEATPLPNVQLKKKSQKRTE
jgi:hypothetical protein